MNPMVIIARTEAPEASARAAATGSGAASSTA